MTTDVQTADYAPATSLHLRIGLTLGDPAGIGPEVAAKLLAGTATRAAAEIHVFADASELDEACRVAGIEVPRSLVGESESVPDPGQPRILVHSDDSRPKAIPIGEPSQIAGERALHQLRRAVAASVNGEIDGFVFAPLNKTSLHLAGMHDDDELRWFASLLAYEGTTSELNAIEGLWTARVTSHIALREVADRITITNVVAAIELLHRALSDFGIDGPRLAVAALNPHAGENGSFGREEIDQIAPAISVAQQNGIDVVGPLPSDTIFLAARKGQFDGVVTMFHDQGQIAMKSFGFEQGVTIQGGLPIVITTPAHGTAFPIVGQGVADPRATEHAFMLATKLATGRLLRQVEPQG